MAEEKMMMLTPRKSYWNRADEPHGYPTKDFTIFGIGRSPIFSRWGFTNVSNLVLVIGHRQFRAEEMHGTISPSPSPRLLGVTYCGA